MKLIPGWNYKQRKKPVKKERDREEKQNNLQATYMENYELFSKFLVSYATKHRFPGARFSKVSKSFRTRKAIAKS